MPDDEPQDGLTPDPEPPAEAAAETGDDVEAVVEPLAEVEAAAEDRAEAAEDASDQASEAVGDVIDSVGDAAQEAEHQHQLADVAGAAREAIEEHVRIHHSAPEADAGAIEEITEDAPEIEETPAESSDGDEPAPASRRRRIFRSSRRR